jgi:hypothetical protein
MLILLTPQQTFFLDLEVSGFYYGSALGVNAFALRAEVGLDPGV